MMVLQIVVLRIVVLRIVVLQMVVLQIFTFTGKHHMKYCLIATLRILPGKEAEVYAALRLAIEGTAKESGNERYDMYFEKDNPSTIIVYEIFRDEASYKAHV